MEWISVEDKLPEEDQKVICHGSSGIFIGDYYTLYKYWRSDKYDHIECTEDFEPVTHWMLLPEKPK